MPREILNTSVVFAFTVSLYVIARQKLWQRYPAFCLYVLALICLTVGYSPESETWLRKVWAILDPITLGLKVLAIYEIYRLQSLRFANRHRLTTGLAMAVLIAVLATWRYAAQGALLDYIHLRRYIGIAAAAFLGCDVLILWMHGLWYTCTDFRHLGGLTAISLAQSGNGLAGILRERWPSASWWHAADASLYIAWAVTFLMWSIWISPRRLRIPAQIRAPLHGLVEDQHA